MAGGEQEQPPRESGASAEAIASPIGGTEGGPTADEIAPLEAQVRSVSMLSTKAIARRPSAGDRRRVGCAAAAAGPGRSLGARVSQSVRGTVEFPHAWVPGRFGCCDVIIGPCDCRCSHEVNVPSACAVGCRCGGSESCVGRRAQSDSRAALCTLPHRMCGSLLVVCARRGVALRRLDAPHSVCDASEARVGVGRAQCGTCG